MRRMRVGFTLVELVIVIMIIGVLGGVLMLSMFSTTDSTRASVLISNLRNAKAASNMWFAVNVNSTDVQLRTEWIGTNMPNNLREFVDADKILKYVFIHIPGVGYFVGEPDVNNDIVKKALGIAKGLLFDTTGGVLTESGGSSTVCIRVK